MAFAGMFALGIFVGGVVTLGFKGAAASTDNFLKIMGAVLTATFSGAAVTFMDKIKIPEGVDKTDPRSFFMYPIGLVVALLWLYFKDVWAWGEGHEILKWVGPGGIVAITLLAMFLALSERFRDWLEPK